MTRTQAVTSAPNSNVADTPLRTHRNMLWEIAAAGPQRHLLSLSAVSDERCKWPNTPSCGLARKGRYDRNTVGREPTIIEGSG